MKIKVDEQEVFQLEEWEKKAIKHLIREEDFEEDMKRRLEWVLKHKAEQAYKSLQNEWLEKLQADPSVSTIPADKAAFVEFVTSRPDYEDRSKRDKKEKAK